MPGGTCRAAPAAGPGQSGSGPVPVSARGPG